MGGGAQVGLLAAAASPARREWLVKPRKPRIGDSRTESDQEDLDGCLIDDMFFSFIYGFFLQVFHISSTNVEGLRLNRNFISG